MRKLIGFILLPRFEKAYKKSSKNIQKSFHERRDLLLTDPKNILLAIHKLHGDFEAFWSMKVTGDVRAVFQTEGFIALFYDIGTHSQLYGE